MPNPFKLNPPCLCRVLLRRRLEGRADKNVMDVIIKDIKAKGRLVAFPGIDIMMARSHEL